MADQAPAPEVAAPAAPESPQTAAAPDPAGDPPRTIAYDRFREVYQQRGEYKATAELVPGLETQIATLTAERDALQSSTAQHAEERALWVAGLTDDEGQAVARLHYGRLPESDRPEGGIGAWLATLGGDEGQTAPPKSLAPFLSSAADPPPAPEPTGNAGVRQTPAPTGAPITAGKIREIREQALRTGDWSGWEEIRGSVIGSLAR